MLQTARASIPLILVVDDELHIAQLLADLLIEEIDCEVISASNGAQALQLVRERLPHLIITDLMMPKMDGRAFVHAIQAEPALRHIPVIIMSAARQKPQWVANGAFVFLAKPFEPDEVVRAVDQLLPHSSDKDTRARQTGVNGP